MIPPVHARWLGWQRTGMSFGRVEHVARPEVCSSVAATIGGVVAEYGNRDRRRIGVLVDDPPRNDCLDDAEEALGPVALEMVGDE
jgi:predicted secreted protein